MWGVVYGWREIILKNSRGKLGIVLFKSMIKLVIRSRFSRKFVKKFFLIVGVKGIFECVKVRIGGRKKKRGNI